MCKALSILEKHRIVHRDLKPDNVLITANGDIKIIDFGLSLVALTKDDILVKAGTPGFLAPEILKQPKKFSGIYSIQTDLYAVGVIHYCMIAGTHPFYSTDYNEVIKMNKKGDVSFKEKEFKKIRNLELNICQNLMNPDPSLRIDLYTLEMDLGFLKQQIEDEDVSKESNINSKMMMQYYDSINPTTRYQGLKTTEKNARLSKANSGSTADFRDQEHFTAF